MPAAPVKVLYVAGLGHSGSTLLGALLGQLDGFFFVGELASTAHEVAKEGGCGYDNHRVVAKPIEESDRERAGRLACDPACRAPVGRDRA